MPSPIGHALAGVAVAWAGQRSTPTADRRVETSPWRTGSLKLTPTIVVCAILAALPDIDLVLPGFHRTYTHSVTAVLVVIIVAAAMTGKVRRWRTALICGAAYASHLLLDWLGADDFPPFGIQLFWPFSGRWYISGWDVFRQTARRHFFTLPIIRQNFLAVAQELAILLPILGLVWFMTRPRRQVP
jgi:inner membrane protein